MLTNYLRHVSWVTCKHIQALGKILGQRWPKNLTRTSVYPVEAHPTLQFLVRGSHKKTQKIVIFGILNYYVFGVTPHNRPLTILKTPDEIHTSKLAFTEPVYLSTPVGETKMPLPMMEPTITVIPLRSDIFASSAPSTFPSSASSASLFSVSASHSSSSLLLFGALTVKQMDLKLMIQPSSSCDEREWFDMSQGCSHRKYYKGFAVFKGRGVKHPTGFHASSSQKAREVKETFASNRKRAVMYIFHYGTEICSGLVQIGAMTGIGTKSKARRRTESRVRNRAATENGSRV
ncbi:hypothetical protein EVAR_79926_1 [Eumeta japonica]|uniref:Uncharacterized protein n=1 Tax=Eumeta variegata TaxID=151549 RepID=A0A4C1TZU6_EUMVA|nr:hypothetical protein EVAR_79926_1 [Eumeta japonica]